MDPPGTRSQPKRRGAMLSADRVLNASSPIGKAETDLLPFFHKCVNDWSVSYSEEEKEQIISTLPPKYRKVETDHEGKIVCPLSRELILGDPFFRDSIARFQRDVSDGYWTATWRLNAKKASEERASGKFDSYLQQNAEDMFGDGTAQVVIQDAGHLSSDGEPKISKAPGNRKADVQSKMKSGKLDRKNRRMAAEIECMDFSGAEN